MTLPLLEIREFVRKVAEVDTEAWLQASLPPVHTLPDPAVIARQMVAMRDAVLGYLGRERDRAISYLKANTPVLAPIDPGAFAALPVQATVTYHDWLEGLVRALEPGRAEFTKILREHLQEAVGTGGEAGLRPAGGMPPGFALVSRKEATALRDRLKVFAESSDPEAQVVHQALASRVDSAALSGAVLRDGAGRVVAAATYTGRGALSVRHLGALEGLVPGTGVQMIRELAGLAVENGVGVEITPTKESAPVFADLGFVPLEDGRFVLTAAGAAALAAGTHLPVWAPSGFLEGSVGSFEVESTEVKKAIAPLAADGDVPFGSGLVALRGTDGTLLALAHYALPRRGKELLILDLWVSPTAPPATGRRLLRRLAVEAAKHGRSLSALPAEGAIGLYGRMGMVTEAKTLTLAAPKAAALATGLTRGATFLGEISFELAVAGAAEWLERDVIPGVVDEVSATTHRRLVDTLVDGLNRGQGMNDLIARIRALDDTTFGLARAERIARTEVITANRAGHYFLAIKAGCTEKKWVSRLMPNTRAWHREAHDQTRPMEEPFQVANRKGAIELLRFPGDRSLGAGPDQIIQCACDYHTIKIGVNDPATYARYDLAAQTKAPGPVIALAPEPVKKWGRSNLDDLRAFVTANKTSTTNLRRLTRR